jgi:hypothetical protein
MQNQNKTKKKRLKVNFDMIESDKQFYLQNCNFNELQEKIFKDLTGKYPMSIIQISMKENISDSTVSRNIKTIKLKMLKAIMTK